MSYREPDVCCDWCRGHITDGDEVACAKCVKDLEAELGKAEDTAEELNAEVERLGGELDNIKQVRIFGEVEQ